MKVKIFHARRIVDLEQAVNTFLELHEVSVQHTQFSTVYAQDEVEHLMFHTMVVFYYPRVEYPDPFAEEEVLVTRQGDNPFEDDEVAPDDTPQPPY